MIPSFSCPQISTILLKKGTIIETSDGESIKRRAASFGAGETELLSKCSEYYEKQGLDINKTYKHIGLHFYVQQS